MTSLRIPRVPGTPGSSRETLPWSKATPGLSKPRIHPQDTTIYIVWGKKNYKKVGIRGNVVGSLSP